MNSKQKKTPISQEKIFKIMFGVTIVVSFVFLVKNILEKNMTGSILVGASILIFAVILFIMQKKQAQIRAKQLVLAIGLLFLVFIISVNTGASYSDDFIMFLAIIGMTGLYLEPKFTAVQIVLSDICLVVMYQIHPEKAESLGNYIQCLAEFTLAGILFYQTIKRGRAFIGISEEQAKESGILLESMSDMGKSLEVDFAQSASQIEHNTQELQSGSDSIVQSANAMTDCCNDVQDRIRVSEQSIVELNDEVSKFEQALTENSANMETMSQQLASVSETIYEANEVFQAMEKKMSEVADIAEQLNTISFNTSILSLNASIEAARAGKAGAGFDVVATEMRELSNNSNVFSEQVSDVVKEILVQVGKTAEQFMDSTEGLKQSEATMQELQESFTRLTKEFDSLYGNIATQNSNVNQVNVIFSDLKGKIIEMKQYSSDNQEAVEAIVDAMELYKVNINHVIENTRKAGNSIKD